MKKNTKNTIKVVELFAGVGGFRIGLENASKNSPIKFKTEWASQWEPGKTIQHAAAVYKYEFFRKDNHKISEDEILEHFSNEDIFNISGHSIEETSRIKEMGELELLVGGFPCQDYSVARTLSSSMGLQGKKGVLWWSIYNILHYAKSQKKPTPYIFLENVDRLLKSPANKRGRDFAIILSSLAELDYIVEWRVINAADYGFPQKRRRTFIVAYHKNSEIGKRAFKKFEKEDNIEKWSTEQGVLANAFPIKEIVESGHFTIATDPEIISSDFVPEIRYGKILRNDPFKNSGVMMDCQIFTAKVTPFYEGEQETLGKIVSETDEEAVLEKYYIEAAKIDKWREQKGAHAYERTSKSGHSYYYKEGALPFPDKWDSPSRTIITGEGGASASRMKHVVDITNKDGYKKGRKIGNIVYKYRRLIPEELEELCMFERGHTKYMTDKKGNITETPDTKRAFFMGNALVVGAIKKVGESLIKHINKK